MTLSLESTIPKNTEIWESLRAKRNAKGWHYIEPAHSTVAVKVDKKTIITRQVQIAQHGVVAFTPAMSGGTKVTANIKLDPVTGARTEMTFEGDSFDPGLVTKVGDSGASMVEAAKLREKEDSVASQLERKKNILQLRKDISALQGN